MIKNIRSIYLRDLKAIFKHKAALLTITALCVLPSLYTLVNVGAIWNPYSTKETGQIPVAVVNQDAGSTLNNQKLNFGSQVIKTLKSNNKVGWRFVDKNTAEHRLKQGKYYAEIIIPKDFSSKLASVTTGNPQRAKVVLKTNTKNSPMGVKITETAAQTLVTEIKNKFVYQINETVFSYLNKAGNKLGNQQANILQLKDLIISLDDGMDLATNSLSTIGDTATGMAAALSELKAFNTATQGNNTLQTIADINGSGLQSARSSLNSAADNVKDNINQVTTRQSRLNRLYSQLSRAIDQNNRSRVASLSQSAKSEIDILKTQTKILAAFLNALGSNNPQINSLSRQLNNANSHLNSEEAAIRSLESSVGGSNNAVQSAINRAIRTNQKVNSDLNANLNTSINSATGSIDSAVASMIHSSQQASTILGSFNRVKQLNNEALDNAISGNKLIANSANKLYKQLLTNRGMINKISSQLKLTSDGDIAKILSILQSNPKLMAGNLTSLFNVKTESIYRVASFGEAFAPSYMAISVWVGCTMLISVLKTTIPRKGRFKTFTRHEEYFGKMFLFWTLSLVQTFIIITSSLFILHIHVANMFMMYIVGAFVSITFSTMIYTASSLLGNLGTALMVMMIALQLAGSGAMYPVQLNPLFFRIIQPLFPFTYGVGAFREVIGGINISSLTVDFFFLTVMSGIAILIGSILKIRIVKISDNLHQAFKDTGIGE
ncbi:YhgE/Pip domain-containing protein [Lentilactobacillus sp. SPB1-3]|uniref:YhgE/Pip family protein n=1 Tax=Lentilactobacillus terminaliae TaxID=3003483 RepID=A0ACD5DE08_9LACO|nr:YhgE/Pip domain-containing protein [Lentilactobacillus sp. SPB1-3]MCZ0977502.1 YhgE/Pip domain-containing protein [Lentilactobacillus sp. SPB1-3]